jgi:hypothetical protein
MTPSRCGFDCRREPEGCVAISNDPGRTYPFGAPAPMEAVASVQNALHPKPRAVLPVALCSGLRSFFPRMGLLLVGFPMPPPSGLPCDFALLEQPGERIDTFIVVVGYSRWRERRASSSVPMCPWLITCSHPAQASCLRAFPPPPHLCNFIPQKRTHIFEACGCLSFEEEHHASPSSHTCSPSSPFKLFQVILAPCDDRRIADAHVLILLCSIFSSLFCSFHENISSLP